MVGASGTSATENGGLRLRTRVRGNADSWASEARFPRDAGVAETAIM